MEENFDITAAQLKEMLDNGTKFNLIDVRNPDEYDEDNLGALLMPLGDLADSLADIETMKGEDIYIHCRSGARSDRAKLFLIANGFSKVHNVLGGIMAFRHLD
jgi:rhodanese-related sulfurtransferase